MNQLSNVPFGASASYASAFAVARTQRLGQFSLVIENTGANTLSMRCATLSGTTWTPIEAIFTVVPRGNTTRNYSLVDKVIGFFGSGSTTANISTVIRNKSDLRGAQIDLVTQGRKGWGYDPALPTGAFGPTWPTMDAQGNVG